MMVSKFVEEEEMVFGAPEQEEFGGKSERSCEEVSFWQSVKEPMEDGVSDGTSQ